jgi:hypothetical protein
VAPVAAACLANERHQGLPLKKGRRGCMNAGQRGTRKCAIRVSLRRWSHTVPRSPTKSSAGNMALLPLTRSCTLSPSSDSVTFIFPSSSAAHSHSSPRALAGVR